MKVIFRGKVQSYFSAYKLTLVPGVNNVANDAGLGLLAAHASDCHRSGEERRLTTDEAGLKLLAAHLGKGEGSKALLEIVAEPVKVMAAKPKASVETSATGKDKRGAK